VTLVTQSQSDRQFYPRLIYINALMIKYELPNATTTSFSGKIYPPICVCVVARCLWHAGLEHGRAHWIIIRLHIAASHFDQIIKQPFFHRRAFNNTVYLVTTFVEALLILVPQPTLMVGIEIVIINLLVLQLPLRNICLYPKSKQAYFDVGWTIYPAFIFVTALLLGIAGGAGLIGNLNWGIYLVTTSCVTLLVTVVFCAWAIMLAVGKSVAMTKEN